MERSEPSLVPEWLRCSGSISGAGNLAHYCVSAAHSPINGCSKISIDKDTRHASFLDRSCSANSHHSSSSKGSSKHPYSNFNRNHRDKKRDEEKGKSLSRDFWEPNDFDPLEDLLIKPEKVALRRSCSLLSRKAGEFFPQKAVDEKHLGKDNHSSSNGLLPRGICGNRIQKTAFDRDFPSLGTEEIHKGPEVVRVPSPGVITATQSLLTGSTSLSGGERWTSALAEVPTIIGSNSRPVSVQQNTSANALLSVSSPMAGPNMAEALSQLPSQARDSLQLPDKTQMLEELAIKQSKQLIPVTPSIPKGSVLNSDKSKPKISLRSSETLAAKSVQRHSQGTNQFVRGGQGRFDGTTGTRQSNGGKFFVLKPVRDNGVPGEKDLTGAAAISKSDEVAKNPLAVASVCASNVRSPTSPKASDVGGKVAAPSLNSRPCREKRPSLSQVQSRSDFFKLMRKKYSTNTSGSPSMADRSAESVKAVGASASPCITENRSTVISNRDAHEEEKNLSPDGMVCPDEEEAAFLRSLGWDENAGEDDGLTEEEINSFYEEYMKMKPSLKLCKDVEQKITSLCEGHTTGSSGASSELSFSETETEA